jgi:hypothetical protein
VVDGEQGVAGVHPHPGVDRRQLQVGNAQPGRQVLELAVVVGHAHRADVVALHEQHLDDGAAVAGKPLGVGDHLHALLDRGHAGRQQLARALDLDHAQAAGADVAEAVQVAQGRDLDAVLGGDLQDRLALGAGDVGAGDLQGVDTHLTTSLFPTGQTPAGQVRSWMWARYSSRK